MTEKTFKRNIFQRIFGIPATKPPADSSSWNYADGKLVVELNKIPELSKPFGAFHLEGENLPVRVLVMQDGGGDYRAFENKCQHAGRKLDPVPGTETIQCCSVGQAVYDYEGNVVSGSVEKPIQPLGVIKENVTLSIEL